MGGAATKMEPSSVSAPLPCLPALAPRSPPRPVSCGSPDASGAMSHPHKANWGELLGRLQMASANGKCSPSLKRLGVNSANSQQESAMILVRCFIDSPNCVKGTPRRKNILMGESGAEKKQLGEVAPICGRV